MEEESVSNAAISNAAYALLNYCVLNDSVYKRGKTLGGVIRGVGTSSDDCNLEGICGLFISSTRIPSFRSFLARAPTSTDNPPQNLIPKRVLVTTGISIPIST